MRRNLRRELIQLLLRDLAREENGANAGEPAGSNVVPNSPVNDMLSQRIPGIARLLGIDEGGGEGAELSLAELALRVSNCGVAHAGPANAEAIAQVHVHREVLAVLARRQHGAGLGAGRRLEPKIDGEVDRRDDGVPGRDARDAEVEASSPDRDDDIGSSSGEMTLQMGG